MSSALRTISSKAPPTTSREAHRMSTDTTQYTQLLEQGQEAVRQAVDTWTRALTSTVGQLPTVAPQFDAEAAIDRYFELNEKLLAAQKDFAKQVVGYTAAAAAKVT